MKRLSIIICLSGLLTILNGCQNNPMIGLLITVTPTATTTATPTPTPTITATATSTPTATPTPDPSMEDGQPLIARVNKHPIFLSDYEAQLIREQEALSNRGKLTAQAERLLSQLVLDGLIDSLVLELIATDRGITIESSEIETLIQTTFPTEDEREQWLNKNRLTYEQLTQQLYQERLISKIFSQLIEEQISLTPDNFDNWLLEQRSIMTIEQYNISRQQE